MTELSFLIELLLKHKLPTLTKNIIAERIAIIQLAPQVQPLPNSTPLQRVPKQAQSPSTLAMLERDGPLPPVVIPEQGPAAIAAAPPVAVIAQTPAAAVGMANRNQAIAIAASGNPEKGRSSPRKF